jgi:hypothetical protein
VEIEINNSDPNIPESLLQKLLKYWKYKGLREAEKAYQYEAPHIKYQLDSKKYIALHKKARKLNAVKFLNIEEKEDLAIIRVSIFFMDNDKLSDAVLNDRWIKLEGVWYHAYENRLINIL